MQKTVLITGSTDGIGLETAKMLFSRGYNVLLHGRSATKLENAKSALSALSGDGSVETCESDISQLANVETLAETIRARYDSLNVLINNAGVYSAPNLVTPDNLDVRFAVNTIAPYLLTRKLLPLLGESGRVVNLSSAAQAPVDPMALSTPMKLSDGEAYAQSKLALTMWSRTMGLSFKDTGPVVVAVNPGSMLGSKMVKDAFGVDGGDLRIGGDILTRAALSDEFGSAAGLYFDNDSGDFASPHPDALDSKKSAEIVSIIETILSKKISIQAG